MRRLEVLGSRSKAIGVMTGAVLAHDLDPELQSLTQTTSRELDMSMAAVTLVLERVQFFRAAVGLPPELTAARATDRDISFCQLVVRDASVLEITDAANDPRVPQQLVERYGLSSYLGAPISIGGEIVGAMCVADPRPRSFSDVDRATIVRMARVASARLEVLALQPRDRERALHDRTVRPVFGELRNRLVPLLGDVAGLEAAFAELEASHRLVRFAVETGETAHLEMLTRADRALDDVRDLVSDLTEGAAQIHRSIIALERASLVSKPACNLADVIDAAGTLSFHRTKLVAGVQWTGERGIALVTARPVAINVLAAALGALSEALYDQQERGGIDAAISCVEGAVVLRLASRLTRDDHRAIADQLQLLIGETAGIGIDASDSCVQIQLAARTPRLAA